MDSPDLQIRFVTPPAFHEVPVLGTEDEVAEQLWELVCEVLPASPDGVRLGWALELARLVPPMVGAGVVHAGFCLTAVGDRVSSASLLAAVRPLGPVAPGRVAVEETAAALARARPEAEVTTVELPAGRAAVLVGAVPAGPADGGPLDGGPVGGGALDGGPVCWAIQVHLPLPNGRQLLSLELSTPCHRDWELYSEVFAGVVRSLHLEFADLPLVVPPRREGTGAPGGSRVRAAFG